jgi:hypothetical protein
MNTYELIKRSEVKRMLAKDAESYTSKPADWIKNNTEPIYVGCNAWLNLINQTSAVTCQQVKAEMISDGLTSTIKRADTIADKLLHEQEFEYDPIWVHLLQVLLDRALPEMQRCLFVLRFLKRVCLKDSDKLAAEALNSFYALNKYLGEHTWSNTPFAQTSMGYELRRYFEERWSWIEDYPYDDEEYLARAGWFSNGAANDIDLTVSEDGRIITTHLSKGGTVKALYSKVEYLCRHIAYLDSDRMFPTGHTDVSNTSLEDIIPTQRDDGLTGDLIQAVEKSLSKKRIIGIANVKINFFANAGRKLLELHTDLHYADRITYKEQRINALAAQVASIDHRYATIDHSNASDSHGYSIIATLMPINYVKHCECLRSKYLIDRETGVIRRNNIWFTSGHPYTYLHESYNFLYLADFATEKVDALLGEDEEPCLKPFTCGDDLFLDSRVVEFYVDLASRLGITVGESKSFWGPANFRESCGVEAYEGSDVSGKKWPRSQIDPDSVEGIVSLLDLQHTLYSEYAVRGFLTEYIREKEPGMTSSLPCTNCTDLWETPEAFVLRADPYKPITGWNALKQWCQMGEGERRRVLFEDSLAKGKLAWLKDKKHFDKGFDSLWIPKRDTAYRVLLGSKNLIHGYSYPTLRELTLDQKLMMACGTCGLNCPKALHAPFGVGGYKPAHATINAMWSPVSSCPYIQDSTEPSHWKTKSTYEKKGFALWWEAWNYAKFLKDGPTYEDKILRSVGVSSATPRYQGQLTGVKSLRSAIDK